MAGRCKVRKMIFCLAEAACERVRARLAAARSLTFHSDVSKNRLLLLCEMCGYDLVPGHGLLGTADLEDDPSAAGLTRAMLRILKDLFTPLTGAPRAPKAQTETDVQALAHVANIAEVFNADAAADEQLAGRMLQIEICSNHNNGGGAPDGDGGGAPAISAAVFPNLKVVNKDKPHGARRITSRTWECDPYLAKIAEDVVMSSSSIAQMLQHSDVMRSRYSRHVREACPRAPK